MVLQYFTQRGESLDSPHIIKNNLLGLPAITALQLTTCLNAVHTKADLVQHFPNVFHGLGNLRDEFEIKLKPDAKLYYALSTPRNVALPLRPKVAQELARMEAMGVISKVDTPTPWCAGMVVVPKKSGKVPSMCGPQTTQ